MKSSPPPAAPVEDYADCVASPYPVGQRIRQKQYPNESGIVTELTPHGFKYKLDHAHSIGRAAWGWMTDSGEVISRSWYPDGGFEPEPDAYDI